VGQVQPKHRRVKAALADLREAGATAATFHDDGTIASVTFAPVVAATAVASRPLATVNVAAEILASPLWPKSDLDVLDKLPDYDAEQN
jgi:hypothetical protein